MTIPDEYLPQIMIALEHHAAYLSATRRDGRPFEEIVRELQHKAQKGMGSVKEPVLKYRRIRRRRPS